MSLFTPIATFTLSDQWQFTDVLVGSYFRVVHLTQPLNQDGQLQESSAAIAQADITGFIYTQDDFSHQTDPQSFILEKPDILEVRKIGFRLLPSQTPWNIRVEALDATLLPGASSEPGAKGDKGDKGDTGTPGAVGSQGLKGDKGDTGTAGAVGPQGLKGDKGDTGAVGPQGLKGDKGDTGAVGPQGLKGDKGDTGTPDLSIYYTKSQIDGLLALKQALLPGTGIVEVFRTAQAAIGYTLTSVEINALKNLLDSLSNSGHLSDVFGLYPFIGSSQGCHSLNLIDPNTGILSNWTGAVSYSAASGSVITNGGVGYPSTAFMDAYWTSSNYRAMFVKFANLQKNDTKAIWGLEGFSNTVCYLSIVGSKGGIHGGNNDIQSLNPPNPINSRIAFASKDAGSNQIIDRAYLNGSPSGQSVSSARANNKIRLLAANGTNNSGTVGLWLLHKRSSHLTDGEVSQIDTAISTYLQTVGR